MFYFSIDENYFIFSSYKKKDDLFRTSAQNLSLVLFILVQLALQLHLALIPCKLAFILKLDIVKKRVFCITLNTTETVPKSSKKVMYLKLRNFHSYNFSPDSTLTIV